MAVSKKFWLYAGIAVLVILLAIAAVFGYMYLNPGKSVFGLKYVAIQDSKNYVYREDTDHSITGLKNIKIETDMSNIVIAASQYGDVLNVKYVRKYSGFTRDEGTSKYELIISGDDTDKTFTIRTTEKYSGLTSSQSFLYIYLPNTFDFDSVRATSTQGNITYSSASSSVNMSIDSVELDTRGNASINIGKLGTTDDYLFRTQSGNVVFNEAGLFSANKIRFATASGGFYLKKTSSQSTKISATEGFYVDVSGEGTMSIDELDADLHLTAFGGNYKFGIIGSQENNKNAYINANKITLTCSQVYGLISMLDNDMQNISNQVSISKIVCSSADTSTINCGSGEIFMNEVSANIAVQSTSGKITLLKVAPTCSVYAGSKSGDISVTYVQSDSMHASTSVKVLSETGDINVANVSGTLYAEALKSSPKAAFNISFNAVVNSKDSYIISKDRNVSLKWIGNSDNLKARLYTEKEASFRTSTGASSTIGSQVFSTDGIEYNLEGYKPTYNHQYRILYTGAVQAANAGKLFVTGSKDVVVTIVI